MFSYTEEGVKQMAEYLQSQILRDFPERYLYSDELFPVIFLAGAPGAGKTEWIESFPDRENYAILDTDLYRSLFEGYTGSNASTFHQYASRVMDRMFSFCIKQGYNMIVDGTFSNQTKAEENIAQCQKRGVPFSVVLVMQDPVISYLYTKKREQEKRRNVPTEAFIEKYYKSIEGVKMVMGKYPEADILIASKDKIGHTFQNQFALNNEMFDRLTYSEYTPENLSLKIGEIDTQIVSKNISLASLIGKQLKNR